MILSRENIEEIAAAVMKDFGKFFFREDDSSGRTKPRCTPIDQLASQYLGLDVCFARLSPDGSLCGVTAYEDTEYQIEEMGVTRKLKLKRNEIVLDRSFIEPGNIRKLCGKRRFTLAHECAHQILFQMESNEKKCSCRKMYEEDRTYSVSAWDFTLTVMRLRCCSSFRCSRTAERMNNENTKNTSRV